MRGWGVNMNIHISKDCDVGRGSAENGKEIFCKSGEKAELGLGGRYMSTTVISKGVYM